MKELKQIISKYDPKAIVVGFKETEPTEIKKGGWYTITAYPESLHQCIKDYVECHYRVIKEDNFSITFRTK